MGSRRQARTIALQALYSWDVGRVPEASVLAFAWVEADRRTPETLTFARLLVSGTIENADEIDRLIVGSLKGWTLERLARVDLAILRFSTYSLLYQPDISARITIDEAIDLAKRFGAEESYRFVNGVLDAIRQRLESGEANA
ncbi:MAG: transcription antitermination factor NusB [Spirochaetales bacterium]